MRSRDGLERHSQVMGLRLGVLDLKAEFFFSPIVSSNRRVTIDKTGGIHMLMHVRNTLIPNIDLCYL